MDVQGVTVERRKGYTLVLEEEAVIATMCALKQSLDEQEGKRDPGLAKKPNVVN